MQFSKKYAIHQLPEHLPQLPAGVLLGVLVLVLPAFAQTEEKPTEQSQEMPPTEEEMNPQITIPESETDLESPPADDPTASETVTVRGEVLQMLNPNAALILDEMNGEVLVISDQDLNVVETEPVEVTGVVSRLSLSEANQTYSLDLPTEIESELMNTPIVIAQTPQPNSGDSPSVEPGTEVETPTSDQSLDSEMVTVQGEVLAVIQPQAVLIRDEINGEVLVVSDRDLNLTENALAEITGVVSRLSLSEAKQAYRLDLSTEMESELATTPIVIAQTSPPNPEAQELAPPQSQPMEPEGEIDVDVPTSGHSTPSETIMVRGEVLEVLSPQVVLIRDETDGEVLVVSDNDLDLAENTLVEVMGVLSNLSLSDATESYGLDVSTETESKLANTPIIVPLALR